MYHTETLQLDIHETFSNGEPKFRTTGGKVERLCPCGLTKCKHHVIPQTMKLMGPMDYKGTDLSELFFKQPVMLRSDVQKWWSKYGRVRLEEDTITRIVYLNLESVGETPAGHGLKGVVRKGEEQAHVKEHYSATYANGTPKYRVDGLNVKQQCPCGKVDCDMHVIPSTVEIDSTVPLVLHLKKKVVEFEDTFRGLDAMTCSDIRDWFLGYPLKWDVQVTPKKVRIRMLCRCSKPFDVVPCEACACRGMKTCTGCHTSYQKRYVKKGLCGNCRRTQVIHCEHCNEMVPFVHKCSPLLNMHVSFKFDGVYPPCIRKKKSDDVICPDCNKCMKYKVYHRHQYRQHSDLLPGTGGYTRDYKWHKCPYCDHKNCDITNVREHLKIHLTLRQHECRFMCGASFTRPSAENLHCRIVHGVQQTDVSSLKRVGNELVSVLKKRKIRFVS